MQRAAGMAVGPSFCGYCSFERSPGVAYCSNCGTRLATDPPEQEATDEEICEANFRREDAELAHHARFNLPPPAWQELYPENRRSLRWRWFKSIAGSAFLGLLILSLAAFIVIMLISPQATGRVLAAFALFACGLGFLGFLCWRGLIQNLRVAGKLSTDLSENRKEIVWGYVTAIWEDTPDSERLQNIAGSIIRTPWSRRHTRYFVELKKGGDGTAEEFEIPYRLYRQFKRRDRVQAEIARHSRVMLQMAKG